VLGTQRGKVSVQFPSARFGFILITSLQDRNAVSKSIASVSVIIA